MNDLIMKPLVLQALDALNAQDRKKAVTLLGLDIAQAPPGGKRWLGVAKLAATIGERGLEVEAMRRFFDTQPQTLDHVLAYAEALSKFSRSGEALQLLDALPEQVQGHPAVLHFRGMVASESGNFETAQAFFRRALAEAPQLAQAWYGLATIKMFTPGDPDILAMETARPQFDQAPPQTRSLFLYALAKAQHDTDDYETAARTYAEAANLMRALQPDNGEAWQSFADNTVRDFTSAAFSRLKPSSCSSERVLFVTGLPRSGTTLVEHILASHSAFTGAGEINVTDGAFLASADGSLSAAMAYQMRGDSPDPWGDLGRTYLGLVSQQFGDEGRIVDKTLNQSHLMGLLLHALPFARVIWLRRDPEDCALSIFRTHFRDSLPWSWSLASIAAHMRGEDALFQHWTSLFGDRILTVPYEGLVSDPEAWTRRILSHAGLTEEPQVFAPHLSTRPVMTASVAQVRMPISADRIGSAAAYGQFMDEFRRAYSA